MKRKSTTSTSTSITTNEGPNAVKTNPTVRFLRTRPSQGETLVWLALQIAETDPGEMTFEESLDAVLLRARNEGMKTWQRLNERIDLEEALEAKRKARAR